MNFLMDHVFHLSTTQKADGSEFGKASCKDISLDTCHKIHSTIQDSNVELSTGN